MTVPSSCIYHSPYSTNERGNAIDNPIRSFKKIHQRSRQCILQGGSPRRRSTSGAVLGELSSSTGTSLLDKGIFVPLPRGQSLLSKWINLDLQPAIFRHRSKLTQEGRLKPGRGQDSAATTNITHFPASTPPPPLCSGSCFSPSLLGPSSNPTHPGTGFPVPGLFLGPLACRLSPSPLVVSAQQHYDMLPFATAVKLAVSLDPSAVDRGGP